MIDPTTAGLRDVAGLQLYRRNSFRITGLGTDADRRTVRNRQQKVIVALEAGADVDLGHDLDVDLADVRAAFERILGDARRRLVDELFWLWDTPDASCGCTKSLHVDHDRAVQAHAAALDLEAGGDELPDDQLDELERMWSEAARLWTRALRRTAFWDHVRHRISVLDDKQLDESAVDVIREEMPLTLVKPLIQLAVASASDDVWLAEQARDWPVPAGYVDDQLEQAAEPVYQAVREGLTESVKLLNDGNPREAAENVYSAVMPHMDRLDSLVPPGRHRRTASVCNEVSLVLNNCATVLMDTLGPGAEQSAGKWLASAKELAHDPQGVAMIDQNIATLGEIADAFGHLKSQVAELRSVGRPDLARQMLRRVRRQLAGAPGVEEVDKLLAELGDRGAAARTLAPPRPRDPYRGPSRVAAFFRGLRRALPALIFWGLIAGGVYWLFFTGGDDHSSAPAAGVRVYSEKVSDNTPIGTCIATKDGWNGDKAQVPSVPCDQEHWGEVLGYVSLGAVPSVYPGEDQAAALVNYQCAYVLEQQGLANQGFRTDYVYPGRNDWNEGSKAFENYATCVVFDANDKPLPNRKLTDTSRSNNRDITMTMDMYSDQVWGDPPLNLCVKDKQSYDADRHKVSIVDCSLPHWGQIIAYPMLFPAGTPWPGDAATYRVADTACKSMAVDRGLDDKYHYNTTWPGQAVWQNAAPTKKFYAVCTVSRADETEMIAPLK